eukprot:s395_g32.t1
MNAAHGNGAKGKGKGKSKAKNAEQTSISAPQNSAVRLPPSDSSDLDFLNAVAAAMPEEARIRAQSQLVEEEWSVPTVPHQCLGKRDAVALVPKKELPGS